VLLIAIAASLVLVGVWYMVLWSPGQSSKRAANTRQATAQQKETETAAKVAALNAAKKDMPALQAKLDALKKLIPDSPQLDTVIATLDTAATQSAVDLRSLSPAAITVAPPTTTTTAPPASGTTATTAPAAEAAPPLTPLSFSMSANGKYAQLVDFIHRISATPRLIVVDSLTFSVEGKDGTQTVAIGGRMFMLNKTSTPAGA
jgi:Tfp pilus assembly protein PilO